MDSYRKTTFKLRTLLMSPNLTSTRSLAGSNPNISENDYSVTRVSNLAQVFKHKSVTLTVP